MSPRVEPRVEPRARRNTRQIWKESGVDHGAGAVPPYAFVVQQPSIAPSGEAGPMVARHPIPSKTEQDSLKRAAADMIVWTDARTVKLMEFMIKDDDEEFKGDSSLLTWKDFRKNMLTSAWLVETRPCTRPSTSTGAPWIPPSPSNPNTRAVVRAVQLVTGIKKAGILRACTVS